MLFTNPLLLALLPQARPSAPPATRSLSISPVEPGTLGPAPATLQFTVTATGGQTEVKWAVFNDDWSAATHTPNWIVAPVTNNTATFTATFHLPGQRVQVKSADEALTAISGQVALGSGTGPAHPGIAPTLAFQFEPGANPGTINPVNGIARWQVWIGSNVYPSLLYTTVNGADSATPFSFRGDWQTATLVNGWALVEVQFDATGQFMKLGNPGNPTQQRDSGTVTVGAGTSTPPGGRPTPTGALVFDPVNPGTINPVNGVAPWSVFIGSNTLTSLVWQVFEGPPTFAARGAWQTVTLTGGWAQITANFTASGQFVKIADPLNTGQTVSSGVVTVPQPQPTEPLPENPTPTPTPTGTPVARLDIIARGQSNVYYAQQNAGGPATLRSIIANLTQIPDVRLISRAESHPNTIHSGTYSYANINSQGKWLMGVVGQNPGLWANNDQMTQVLLAIDQFVSADPNHGVLDVKVHWEYDMSLWQSEWNTMYRAGQWEITKRMRARRAKNANRWLTAYGHCSYEGADLSFIWGINQAWAQDWDDGTLMAVCAAGNMVDGQARLIGAGPSRDWSHNDDASLKRQWVRMGIYMSRKLWEMGWCPAGVDLSWLPVNGPAITGGTRSGSSMFLNVALDKDTALVAGADGIRWEDFWCPQLGGNGYMRQDSNGVASGGAITAANQIRVDFKGTVPANSQLHYCYHPRITYGETGRNIIRGNFHQVRPSVSNTIPDIALFDNLLRRTFKAVNVA